MRSKSEANIRVRDGGMARLREIAAQHGAMSRSGINAGEASVSELLDRVISGELVIVRGERTMGEFVKLGETGLEIGPRWDALEAAGKATARAAKVEANSEAEAVDEWDATHCPVCGADTEAEPNHCR